MKANIGIIDYGVGNINSLLNVFAFLGYKSTPVKSKSDFNNCTHFVLPGVGSYDTAVDSLMKNDTPYFINQQIKLGKPFLGICLGMQLLGSSSEEGKLMGLGLIPGKVIKFPDCDLNNSDFRVPHMGWSEVEFNNDFDFPKSRFYFTHSYFFQPEAINHSIGRTDYIVEFSSVILKDNVLGVQFHPEKSHKQGLKFLNQFVLNEK